MSHRMQEQGPVVVLAQAQSNGYPSQLSVAWQRRSLVAVGLAVGLVCGFFYYVQARPVYRSAGQIYVIQKRPQVLTGTGTETRPAVLEDYLSSHAVLIKSPLNVKRAVKKPEVQGLKSLAGLADPAGRVIRSLSVVRDKDAGGNANHILNLSYEGTDPDDCGAILHAVIESYKEFLDETYRSGNTDTQKLITQARDVLENELSKKEAEYKEFRLKSPLLRLKGKDGNNLYQDRLAQIEARRSAVLVRRAEIRGQLAAIDAALKEGRGPELSSLLASLSQSKVTEGDRKAAPTLEERLFPLLLEEQSLLQEYGPDHPSVLSVRQKIAFTRKFAATSALGDKGLKPEEDERQLRDLLRSSARSLRAELAETERSEKAIAGLFEQEQDEARKLNAYEAQEDAFRHDLARAQQLYDGIITRLKEADLTKDLGGYDARTIAAPARGLKVSPKPFVVFPVAVVLGLLGGFGLAWLAYMSDKSFRSPEEVRRCLEAQVVGHLPFCRRLEPAVHGGAARGAAAKNGSAAAATLWSLHQPRSVEAEMVRGVRTALYFSAQAEGHKVIQITSPNPGDGKTTLTTNLAVSIAQSGKKVILIDSDFRRPRVHKIFGLHTRLGLASIIAGEAELPDVIRPTQVPGLTVLPCGPIPTNPAELLTSPRFQELLDAIGEQYDFVLLDTPPLLAVTDPCVVAARVDGVLLVIRVIKNGRPDAERAKEMLGAFGATVVGVVVNGAGGPSGYGYKHYQYADKYAYGYKNYHDRDGGTEPDGVGKATPADGVAPPVPVSGGGAAANGEGQE